MIDVSVSVFLSLESIESHEQGSDLIVQPLNNSRIYPWHDGFHDAIKMPLYGISELCDIKNP